MAKSDLTNLERQALQNLTWLIQLGQISAVSKLKNDCDWTKSHADTKCCVGKEDVDSQQKSTHLGFCCKFELSNTEDTYADRKEVATKMAVDLKHPTGQGLCGIWRSSNYQSSDTNDRLGACKKDSDTKSYSNSDIYANLKPSCHEDSERHDSSWSPLQQIADCEVNCSQENADFEVSNTTRFLNKIINVKGSPYNSDSSHTDSSHTNSSHSNRSHNNDSAHGSDGRGSEWSQTSSSDSNSSSTSHQEPEDLNTVKSVMVDNQEKPYKCSDCGATFSWHQSLRVHRLKKHFEFKCSECGDHFPNPKQLDDHFSAHFNLDPYKCSFCGLVFKHKCRLKRHITRHTTEKPFNCSQCNRCFSQKRYLSQHILRFHTNKVREVSGRNFKCLECSASYKNESTLKAHCSKKHKEFRCLKCDICFSGTRKLQAHISQVHLHECSQCVMSFASKSKLECHLRLHRGEKPFRCELCSVGFSQKVNLMKHVQKQHLKRKELFHCKSCSLSFSQKGKLMKHVQNEHKKDDKPFQCPECSARFEDDIHLDNHINCHCLGKTSKSPHPLLSELLLSKEKQMLCTICCCKFACRRSLLRHLYDHLAEMIEIDERSKSQSTPTQKPRVPLKHLSFTCSECNSAFSDQRALENHLKFHTKERPYQCLKCKASFQRPGRHRWTLKGCVKQELFLCPECPSAFALKSSLLRHFTIQHSKEKLFKCSLCGRCFSKAVALRKHVRFRHK